ncbi:hypothetical protein [Saccharibacillus alkalitolerans]|uniref:Uncharacterized protein n=1 Tax=Saccharibacillus alkalitolerans TaxID=2705290 RepID=A0ABX0FDM6_9BACL|nr:hypothetical protein [Saccharibacillus alkalitolerans]NGZ77681.1 hypothetical protein [Saccharibacillus alkalitolerans]
MAIIIGIILLIANIPVYRFLFKKWFRDEQDFDKSVKYSFTPNLISLFRGKYIEDRIASAKLSFYIFMCFAVVGIEFFILYGLINWIAG